MTAVIEVSHLSKSYRYTRALNDLSFTLEEGSIIGLLGDNGSGKTTLLKILAGQLHDWEGEVRIYGHAPDVRTKAILSYLPDVAALDMHQKVKETLGLYTRFFPDFSRESADSLVEFFHLDPHSRIKELSKGTQEKLQILLAISRQAQVYLLDEPLSGVDPAARERIMSGILTNFAEDSLMLISTHLIHDIEPVLDHALFLKDGTLELSGNSNDLHEQYGCGLEEIFKEVYV
ncbi:MAG: ABC transporter [Actinobacteria bacterium]|nr:MAG: ABC transporter [Actinomycetota bacterium]